MQMRANGPLNSMPDTTIHSNCHHSQIKHKTIRISSKQNKASTKKKEIGQCQSAAAALCRNQIHFQLRIFRHIDRKCPGPNARNGKTFEMLTKLRKLRTHICACLCIFSFSEFTVPAIANVAATATCRPVRARPYGCQNVVKMPIAKQLHFGYFAVESGISMAAN